jgi:hypothetical protein
MARLKSTHLGLRGLELSSFKAIKTLSDAIGVLLNEPLDLLKPALGLTGAFEIIKEAIFLTISLLSDDLPIFPKINPDVIVGQTNTSSDKTVVGTVDSRKVRDRRSDWKVSDPRWLKEQLETIIEAIIHISQYEQTMADTSHKNVKRKPAIQSPVPLPFERPDFSGFALIMHQRQKQALEQKAKNERNSYHRRQRLSSIRGSKR